MNRHLAQPAHWARHHSVAARSESRRGLFLSMGQEPIASVLQLPAPLVVAQ